MTDQPEPGAAAGGAAQMDEETLELAHRLFDAARSGETELLRSYLNAGAPATLTAPLGLLAELTHRCPLGCPYCSNPLALETPKDELDTANGCMDALVGA